MKQKGNRKRLLFDWNPENLAKPSIQERLKSRQNNTLRLTNVNIQAMQAKRQITVE